MSKYKVLITRNDIPEPAVKLLRDKFDVECYPFPGTAPEDYVAEHVKGADALFCCSPDTISERVIEAGSKLKIIATCSLGYEHINLNACKKRNIFVTNVANPIYTSIVAEFTVGLLLTVARRLVEADAVIRRGEWTDGWNPHWLLGRGLVNSKVGIVGMGRIGQRVLEMILPFHVDRVLYHDIYHPIEKAESLGAKYADFDDLLKESDFIIVNCNLTEKNRGVFNSRAFSLMKPNAVFINTSRGGIVDQEALIQALKNKQIRAAGIDVMYPEPLPRDHEFFTLPNLVLTPHIGAAEKLALEKNSVLTAENIIEVLEGRPALTPVY